MDPDSDDRPARWRGIVEVNRETSRELCATAARTLAESKELVQTSRALSRRRASRKPEGQE
jgi:hypothetical protein